MTPGSGKIMYCAIPTRMQHLREEAKRRARIMGFAPLCPFDCMEYEDSEGNPDIGRARTLRLDIDIMKACDVVGVFGISGGVLGEVNKALELNMDIRVVHGLDPEWEINYAQLKDKFDDPLRRLRGPHHLFVLIGPSAVGKTYWSDRLIQRFSSRLLRVKTTTTRKPRPNQRDHESYNFISRDAFERGITDHQFLEYDQHFGNYYGSSQEVIHDVLKNSSGIFAITPTGAAALYDHRFEISIINILLLPQNPAVLLKNFARRGYTDEKKRAELLLVADQFTLPSNIVHTTVLITDDHQQNENNLVRITNPYLDPFLSP